MSELRVSFEPDAIREHFEAVNGFEHVDDMSDGALAKVAEIALEKPQLWATFDNVLQEALQEFSQSPEIEPHIVAITTRLTELAKLEDGWHDGKGKKLPAEQLEWLAQLFSRFFPADLPAPDLHATDDGEIVQAEWTIRPWEASLTIDLEDMHGDWHNWNSETDIDVYRSMNMATAEGWDLLRSLLQECVTPPAAPSAASTPTPSIPFQQLAALRELLGFICQTLWRSELSPRHTETIEQQNRQALTVARFGMAMLLDRIKPDDVLRHLAEIRSQQATPSTPDVVGESLTSSGDVNES